MDTVNWTRELDEMIREAVARYGINDWGKVCQKLRTQHITPEQCQARWENVLREQTVKGPWSEEEDAILRSLVEKFGPKKWSTIASYINGRIGKQCRERWLNHLSPNVSKDVWTEEEDEILINAQIQMGNKWSYISKLLPGRSENAVKNRYNSIASRNGVRKKRLGTFVNRSQLNHNSLMKLQLTTKRNSSSRPQACVNKQYDTILKKAEAQIQEQNQRLSLQLPTDSISLQSISSSCQTPTNTRSVPSFQYDTNHDPLSYVSLYPDTTLTSPNKAPSFIPLDGIVDTSDMTLSQPREDYSYQQEEENLQQIDSFILSGNTIMGNPTFQDPLVPAEPYQIPDLIDPVLTSDSSSFLTPSIPPVHLRENAKMTTLNRGVYSSWDHDSLNISANSNTSGHGMNTIGNSMNISRRSAKYESTDLLRILNSSENDLHADRLSLFDNTIMMGDMIPVREETPILS